MKCNVMDHTWVTEDGLQPVYFLSTSLDSQLKQVDGKILHSMKENVIYVQNKTLETSSIISSYVIIFKPNESSF